MRQLARPSRALRGRNCNEGTSCVSIEKGDPDFARQIAAQDRVSGLPFVANDPLAMQEFAELQIRERMPEAADPNFQIRSERERFVALFKAPKP